MNHLVRSCIRCALVISASIGLQACGDDTGADPDAAAPDIDAAVDAAPPLPVPRFEEGTCRFTLHPDQTEGETVTCGDLVVYEDRTQENGATIRLHVARFHRPDSNASPTVFLNGGPGGSSAGLVAALDNTFTSLFTRPGDFIAIDQRGVGMSIPRLDCEELANVTTGLEDPAAYAADVIDAMNQCRDRLTGDGIDLAAYTTTANAADIEDLRIALGLETINLWGGSYGTRLELEIMRNHPDGLRAVVLDAVVPAQVTWTINSGSTFDDALGRLFAACAADGGCNAAYGDLDQALSTAVSSLNQTPLDLPDLGASINGNDVIINLFNFMYSGATYPIIPALVFAVSQRDAAEVTRLIEPFVTGGGSGTPPARGMHYSITCSDHARYLTEQQLDDAYADVRPEIAAVMREVLGTPYLELCPQWPLPPEDPSIMDPVTSDVNTLLLNGQYDPITPAGYGYLAAETLSSATVVDFPNTGHGSSTSSFCGLDMTLTFLEDPNVAPDTTCTGTLGLEFELPAGIRAALGRRAPIPWHLPHVVPAPRIIRN